MEIKIYTDDSPRKRDRKASAAYAALLRTVALCQDVQKVVMNVTPIDMDVFFDGTQLPRLAQVLSTYPKLKDVTLKVRPESLEVDQWEIFEGFFGLCRKGVSLCFELMAYDHIGIDADDVEEADKERKLTERRIEALTKKYTGKEGDVGPLLNS